MKNTRLFLVALMIAIISWFLLRQQIEKEKEQTIGELERVVLAEVDLEQGTLLTRAHIKPGKVPRQYLSSTTILARDVDTILGQPVIRNVRKDNQLSWDDLARYKPHLSAEIPKRLRAFTLEVEPSSTQGGQLRPGDYVDVLVIFQGESEASCRTILQDIKIIAIGGQRLDSPLTAQSIYSDVTLELTPQQCQHVALARETGRLLLTLRSDQDHETIRVGPTMESNLGQVSFEVNSNR